MKRLSRRVVAGLQGHVHALIASTSHTCAQPVAWDDYGTLHGVTNALAMNILHTL
jgi:hypothetical protein